MIKVNMDKARDIKKDMIRAEREPKLQQLDVEFMRAVEEGDTAAQQAIAGVKQVLRDVTDDQRIADAQTPDDLKALTLVVLTA